MTYLLREQHGLDAVVLVAEKHKHICISKRKHTCIRRHKHISTIRESRNTPPDAVFFLPPGCRGHAPVDVTQKCVLLMCCSCVANVSPHIHLVVEKHAPVDVPDHLHRVCKGLGEEQGVRRDLIKRHKRPNIEVMRPTNTLVRNKVTLAWLGSPRKG